MKKIVLALFYLLVLSCNDAPKKSNTLIDYVPSDAQVIFKINDLEKAKSHLRDNDFIKNNASLQLFSYFNSLPVIEGNKENSNGLLCFSPVGKNDYEYTFISKYSPGLIATDSLHEKTIESIQYAEQTFQKITSNKGTFFATKQDSILIASSSQILIENAIRLQEKNKMTSSDLTKAFQVANDNTPLSILVNGHKLKNIHDSLLPEAQAPSLGIANFSGWISLDTTIDQHAIYLDGIAIEKDSLSSTIGIFDNLAPQENQVAKITPITAKGFTSYTYDDFSILKKNLALAQDRELRDIPLELDEILQEVSEISMIHLENEMLLSLTAHDIQLVTEHIDGREIDSYRNVPIYKTERPLKFSNILAPLIPDFSGDLYLVHEEFVIFATSKNALQTIIANIINKTILAQQTNYTASIDKLSNESSILLVNTVKNIKERIANHAAAPYKKEWSDVKSEEYQHAALQVIKEHNFAHIHGVFKKNHADDNTSPVAQIAATSLENKLLNDPILVKNHRTKGMDYAVQDVTNMLYLISEKGAIFWKKQIDGAILGDIKQIDIYKNGRYQLLFNTARSVYLIDRDGNSVAPYPKRFNKELTLPLSLFDYDKNKRYRIMITQGNEVKMFDGKAKIVSGFTFKNTETNIVLPPKHFRMKGKDYIIIPEENGTMNILSRVGKARVKPKGYINFSANEWYQYQDKFTSINKDGKLVQIDPQGNVSYPEQQQFHKMVSTNKTLVTLSENKLTIKGKTIELEHAVYATPHLFFINNKIYVSITDIQSKKVYLYDSNAQLLPNFPVYGQSAISLGNIDKDSHLEFVVKGEEDSILLYKIKQ
ncbi:hypothetical protein HN014_02545 [Aquimarina sp. TRL1]|uniref:hypothetical protein n=1 Tax=Aquimarina sp. (strain TRL1) TaxID=2736252 RepID=UPI00158ED77E|nr:hypothetical protein [Aquimarina sp. TRL1]QKX03831.1 hypothetical protein HN014_02545 [Aquimarina sp. TRL1]